MAKRRRRKGLRGCGNTDKGFSGLTRGQWRKCKGVNSRTGRIKKGFRATRRGCPVPAGSL